MKNHKNQCSNLVFVKCTHRQRKMRGESFTRESEIDDINCTMFVRYVCVFSGCIVAVYTLNSALANALSINAWAPVACANA